MPSFFRLLKELHRRKVDFKIVFRTFGTDLAKISCELNLFCEVCFLKVFRSDFIVHLAFCVLFACNKIHRVFIG